MNRHSVLHAGVAAGLFAFAGSALAINATEPPNTNIDNFDVDAGVQTVSGVDTFDFTGWAVSDFGAAGGPGITGSTFTDYIVVSGTGFTNQSNSPIGTNINQTYGITYEIVADGVITDGATGAFNFTNLTDFNVYLDTGWTQGDFASAFGNFFDGSTVLGDGAMGLLNALAPQANTGALAPVIGAQGSFQLAFHIAEDAVNTGFLLDAGTNISLFDATNGPLAALPDGDLTFGDVNAAGTAPVVANFAAWYGLNQANINVAAVTVRGSGDIVEVPEPSILMLIGAGLLGMGGLARRKRS